MMRTIMSALLVLGFTGLISGSAAAIDPASHAARMCGPHADVSKQLEQKYSEVPRSFGLVENKSVMELYASAESGTWTIVMTNRSGLSCIVAAGDNWEQIDDLRLTPGA